MRNVLVVVLGVAAVCLTVLVWWRTEPAGPGAGAEPASDLARESSMRAAEPLSAPREPALESARAEAVVDVASSSEAAIAPAPELRTQCELRGRFTIDGGAPAPGVQLSVMGWEANDELVLKYGAPKDWQEPTGASDDSGLFALRFDPPRAYQFVLTATLPGWCDARWRWSEIEPGSIVDIGTVELVRGGSIRGRIVDSKGRALSKSWMVYAESLNADPATHRVSTRVYGPPDGVTGEFLLEGIPSGKARLSAQSQIANWIEGPIVDVNAARESRADILYTGPDNDSRITVVTFCKTFDSFAFHVAEVQLSAPGFETRTATKIAGSSQSFSFDDVPPGTYTVQIDDPLFEPWSKSGVRPGTSVDATLKGSAAVALQVLDENGELVSGYALDVRFDNVGFRPNVFRVLEAGASPPVSGVIDGLIPHDQTLFVRRSGYAPSTLALTGLQPGEKRSAIVRLSRGERVSGRVVSGERREPVESARVALAVGVEGLDTRESASDEQGRFEFEGVPAGESTITATKGPWFLAGRPVSVIAGSPVADVEIVLPAPATLVGKVIAPDGASFDGLRVLAMPVSPNAQVKRMRDRLVMSDHDGTTAPITAGVFRTGTLPAGEVAVRVLLPEIVVPVESGHSRFAGQMIDFGTLVLPADTETHREFDIRSQFPGTIALRVRVNGAPAASLMVTIDEVGHSTAAVVLLDAEGVGRSGPILPGTYSFVTQPRDKAWFDQTTPERRIAAGQSIELEIDVQTVAGALRVIDAATNGALANGRIQLAPDEDQPRVYLGATTDANGDAKLSLPVGRYRVVDGNFIGMHFARAPRIDWTASGPVPASVTIESVDRE